MIGGRVRAGGGMRAEVLEATSWMVGREGRWELWDDDHGRIMERKGAPSRLCFGVGGAVRRSEWRSGKVSLG